MDTDTVHTTPELVELPSRDVLAVDGTGSPEAAAFASAVRALYAVRRLLGAPEDVPLEGTFGQGDGPLQFDLPIGEIARLARLTVKAVRHYDAEGLLVPATVDPHSGYRYYRPEQVRTATTIALLRSLDVPLPVVRQVLAAPDDVAVGVPAANGARVLPGGPWATTLHVGPYTELPLAYTALLEHVRARGHSATGPATETYLTDPSTVGPAELVTRLAVALAGE